MSGNHAGAEPTGGFEQSPTSGPRALNPQWQGRGLAIRVVAYMAGAHVFAAFLFLLFAIGSHHGH
jgi:hypothetical protein